MSDATSAPSDTALRRWRPLSAIDRRIVGVLVEKAKTTPEQYPLSTNALRAGANQKNNRYPLMDLELEDVEQSLDRLRSAGAVTEVQGGGRVARFRHHLYEWLGVDKIELAVMAELLLRGAQTEGELRGRASRMEAIADLATLRAILASLKAKGLVVSLTPEGRGHAVTHALYEARELEKVRAEYRPEARTSVHEEPHATPSIETRAQTDSREGEFASRESVETLRGEIQTLRADLAAVRKDLDELWSQFR